MTYIEFYDRTAVENVAAWLTFLPEKVIFIGNNQNQLNRSCRIYERMAQERGLNICFSTEIAPRSHLDMSLEILQRIVDENEECVFDLSGGEEVLTLALGMICQRNPDKKIRLRKLDLRSNRVYECDAHGNELEYRPPRLSVQDQIRIYGGDILMGDVESELTYRWQLTEEFRRDLQTIWAVCRKSVYEWNDQIAVFEAAAALDRHHRGTLSVSAPIAVLENHLRRNRASYRYVDDVVRPLREAGLITDFREENQVMYVSFKDFQVKRCLTKAGQALELKVYTAAMDLVDEDGEPVYTDGMTGVVLDWDGRSAQSDTGPAPNTVNEIDVLLMHDLMPVFISCKNGTVVTEELYKLRAVAERFGSDYAKPVLVVNGLPEHTAKAKSLRQRMTDMDIRRVEHIQHMTEEELAEKLRGLWK